MNFVGHIIFTILRVHDYIASVFYIFIFRYDTYGLLKKRFSLLLVYRYRRAKDTIEKPQLSIKSFIDKILLQIKILLDGRIYNSRASKWENKI